MIFNMLITPGILVKMLGEREYATFVNGMFPSVPEKTLRNVLKGESNPQKKTIEKMIRDICARTGLEEGVALKVLSPESRQPWKTAFAGAELSAGTPQSMQYAFEVIVRIESAIYQAENAKQKGDSRWFNRFRRAGLPSEILPKQFFDAYLHHGAGSVNKQGQRRVPVLSGKVFLRTSLYCLAALEVAFMKSEEEYAKVGLWVDKAMPSYEDERLVGPMRHMFLGMMKYLGKSSAVKFAEVLPSLKNDFPDPENQRRKILRWMRGEEPPSWETMFMIRDELFDGNSDLLVNYGVARFLQNLFNDLLKHAVPKFFKDEQELVAVFQEYPKWQEHHQKGFAEWSEARDCG
ncbi:protein of unknown function [Pseudodesulfovibrio profundus]|uniref:Uncharacterized protein n=2 Tax=Pseudodesulfovibrio profundus TaxID=57320 RepID=A0A2C8FBZ4_9BACT|nr:protein of unknown function [Pseudodesulfovibrio profundus]